MGGEGGMEISSFFLQILPKFHIETAW